ncbi:MAG: hypothetical protein FJY55_08060 [Betaproteobacteria bacterium]|nr:hypothetical protein [Betaproteobacteria bacterium]
MNRDEGQAVEGVLQRGAIRLLQTFGLAAVLLVSACGQSGPGAPSGSAPTPVSDKGTGTKGPDTAGGGQAAPAPVRDPGAIGGLKSGAGGGSGVGSGTGEKSVAKADTKGGPGKDTGDKKAKANG